MRKRDGVQACSSTGDSIMNVADSPSPAKKDQKCCKVPHEEASLKTPRPEVSLRNGYHQNACNGHTAQNESDDDSGCSSYDMQEPPDHHHHLSVDSECKPCPASQEVTASTEDLTFPGRNQATIPKKGLHVPSHNSDCKIINDPIHGHVEVHPLCVKIMDTPEFQRLRNIKQLGSVYLVYPGAAHNRFEHCLGVSHLARELVKALQQRQPELGITEKDVLCVTIAGLCHDLGHGPYSHLFEQFMEKARENSKWRHEDASVMMFNYIIERHNMTSDFHHHNLFERDMEFIREQIQGKRGNKKTYSGRGEEKGFLYEIVANSKNGVDVDKWDYLARDAAMLGIANSFEYRHFLTNTRVIKTEGKWQICCRDKEAVNLYRLFHTRYFLHRHAYQHKVHQSAEEMLIDVLLCADRSDAITYQGKDGKRLHISECVGDPVAFTHLDDSVFSLVQLSTEPELEKARQLLLNIRTRHLYKLVCETEPMHRKFGKDDFKALTASLPNANRVVVKAMYLDYGMGDKNPIEQTSFYYKSDPYEAVKISKDKVSLILPNKFSQYIVRLYRKDSDEDTLEDTVEAFKNWCSDHDPPPK